MIEMHAIFSFVSFDADALYLNVMLLYGMCLDATCVSNKSLYIFHLFIYSEWCAYFTEAYFECYRHIDYNGYTHSRKYHLLHALLILGCFMVYYYLYYLIQYKDALNAKRFTGNNSSMFFFFILFLPWKV